ncbi:MAG: hypothetical protein K940chlam7_00664 [Chlamydiae bacterium]|nr:hypothetical protein [Chlamydiota bacterium]
MIEIIPYDTQWPQIFETEAKPIRKVLGTNCLALHHIGSTSVPGLSSKPKIDILTVVKHFSSIKIADLERLGYEFRGEVIPSGRYFSKQIPNVNLHVFEEGNPSIKRFLVFRDWLRTHDDDREAYENLKKELANKHTDGMSYACAKTEFINKILEKADGA